MMKLSVLVFGAVLASWLCYSSLHVAAQITDPKEVRALRAVKKNLHDPRRYLRSWSRRDPCNSNWTGVVCYNTTHNDGYLHVKDLQLLKRNLSGILSPELGQFSYLKILDFMWNEISGTIPKELGNIKSLELLLLNGNQITGPLPEELGYLPNLDRIQIDQNQISGPLPKSFANLINTKHFHMNNNSISGQIPPELSVLPSLVHFLLDNNNLSGYLPPQFSELPNLMILQLDNNHFDGTIPASYGNMLHLLKLSLRNCSLQGPVPDLSTIPKLGYLDLSWNQLNGSIPSNRLSNNITTIDLSYNQLNGPIPTNFSGFPLLQRLSLANNSLSGDVPSDVWRNRILNGSETIFVDFQNNLLSDISATLEPPTNASIRLQGNPVCTRANQLNIGQYCGPHGGEDVTRGLTYPPVTCHNQSCPEHYEYVKDVPEDCFCAAPIRVGYRLKSPGFSDFFSYKSTFEAYLTSGVKLNRYQLSINSFIWEDGPRVKMYLKLFPAYNSSTFNNSEIRRLKNLFSAWTIPDSATFGPYELLNFTLLEPYDDDEFIDFPKSGVSKGALAGIVLGAIACSVTLTAVVSILIMRRHFNKQYAVSRKHRSYKSFVKVDGVKGFTFREMALATNNFNSSAEVGQGGYGKVYKGILPDGSIVAIKRALEESLQGEKEFFTEIELLSRVHHRNLVSLVGYCDEDGEQMLVYEFMSNGTLRDHLSANAKVPLSFAMRLRIALGSAKGVLYLHTEANPPIFHRDIKARNILLDPRLTAKVADFGLSKLAPVPDIEGIVPGHVSTVVKGTPGYLDPEYFLTRKLTDKSDVYSLGVVFLELLTGMQPISHGKNIVREVNMAYQSGMIFSVIDGHMGSYPSECVEKFLTLALRCCQEDTDSRPSMAELVRELENIWVMMPESDTGVSESIVTDTERQGTPQYSSSTMKNSYKNPYVSSDISGSDLVSGVVPSITPR